MFLRNFLLSCCTHVLDSGCCTVYLMTNANDSFHLLKSLVFSKPRRRESEIIRGLVQNLKQRRWVTGVVFGAHSKSMAVNLFRVLEVVTSNCLSTVGLADDWQRTLAHIFPYLYHLRIEQWGAEPYPVSPLFSTSILSRQNLNGTKSPVISQPARMHITVAGPSRGA